ncbi:hypothetical protein KY285_010432 [Solanum tuberosum]|nr:hypothetical protein KY289_010984 [Solanum tuberosum]KAH0734725.1 hypothetical protein KY285_010432 [Solanum tuberosum]
MQGSDKDPSLINSHNKTTTQKVQAATTKNNNTSGIDSLIPPPNTLDTIDSNVAEEAVGGMEGRVQETHTNLQEGVSKGGRELIHVLHEVETYDHRTDSRAPATPISNQKEAAQHAIQERKEMNTETKQQKDRPNNKSGGRLSKKKRDAMKKRQGKRRPIQDDYGALNSEDELELDNQSIDEYDEEEEETSNLLIQDFGSTFNTDWSEEVQELTEQQGLSPRGRKQKRHTKQPAITSISATSSRPITRSINTQGSLERLQTLTKMHQLDMIAILEPSADNSQLNIVRVHLQMDHAISNPNGKIWLFWANAITGNIHENSEQHITGDFKQSDLTEGFMVSFIYAKCKEHMRRPLWDSLLQYASLDIPWCTIGDFNVISNIEEKLGGVPYNMNKSFEFISVIEACGLTDLGFTVGSDHSPLLMEMVRKNENHIKYFKFLHCWMDNANFMETVRKCWEREVTVKEFEEIIKKTEEELLTHNTEALRQKLHLMNANYIRYLKLEESILKQKTQLQWFKEGDANTKYFHALIRGRRRRLFIHKICTGNDVWIQGDDQIAQAACDYFQGMFTGQNRRIDERILQHLPTLVTPDQNQKLQEMPTLEELKQVVFAMNPNSAPGPDGIGGKFYQACWNIIKEDLLAVVQYFFCGHIMPKFMSHACLVLLPKKEQPNNFSDLKPISLSNFSNKIISKLLSMILADIIPLLIADNQSGFVRGRSITESIMLAQEITHDIKRPKEGDNVVIKLDMTKAYDRVSWSFTCLVLRRLGFGEFFIDLVWRTMSNN